MIESHPSVTLSLEDFEHDDRASPIKMLYRSTHSGFREGSPETAHDSDRAWSPPAHADFGPTLASTSAWYRREPYRSETSNMRSRSSEILRQSTVPRLTPFDLDGPDSPANIPLPAGRTRSPSKDYWTPSPSPVMGRIMTEPLSSPPPEKIEEQSKKDNCK
jgi:hypothetical protein